MDTTAAHAHTPLRSSATMEMSADGILSQIYTTGYASGMQPARYGLTDSMILIIVRSVAVPNGAPSTSCEPSSLDRKRLNCRKSTSHFNAVQHSATSVGPA
jgi:hypothetical protein